MPDQLVNLDMKHGVEAKNYEEVGVGVPTVCLLVGMVPIEQIRTCSLETRSLDVGHSLQQVYYSITIHKNSKLFHFNTFPSTVEVLEGS